MGSVNVKNLHAAAAEIIEIGVGSGYLLVKNLIAIKSGV